MPIQPLSPCTIVVSSCDHYADCWDPFFTIFFKLWPSCPFPILLISNTIVYKNNPKVQTFLHPTPYWSDNLKAALYNLQTPTLLYFQEDYLLTRPPNEETIFTTINLLQTENWDSIQLTPYNRFTPTPQTKKNPTVEIIPTKTKYRLNTQAALWNKNSLQKILYPQEQGWHFEILGNFRDKKKPLQIGQLAPPTLFYLGALIQGSWRPEISALFSKHNLKLPITRKILQTPPKHSRWEITKRFIKNPYPLFKFIRGNYLE